MIIRAAEPAWIDASGAAEIADIVKLLENAGEAGTTTMRSMGQRPRNFDRESANVGGRYHSNISTRGEISPLADAQCFKES